MTVKIITNVLGTLIFPMMKSSNLSAKITQIQTQNTVGSLLEEETRRLMQNKVIYDEPQSMAGHATSEDVSAISPSPFLLVAAVRYQADETDTLPYGSLCSSDRCT